MIVALLVLPVAAALALLWRWWAVRVCPDAWLLQPENQARYSVRYTTPRDYRERQAVQAARRALRRTKTGRRIPRPRLVVPPATTTVTPFRRERGR
jgi:hypothetical protein